MNQDIKRFYRGRILLSTLALLIFIPYAYLLYQVSLFFLNYHGWSPVVLLIPLAWIVLIIIYNLVTGNYKKSLLYECQKVTPENDIAIDNAYCDDRTAYQLLSRLTQSIFSQLNFFPKVNFYIYPLTGKNTIGKYNVLVFREKNGEFGLMISQHNLDRYPDNILLGVLTHEVSHMVTRWFYHPLSQPVRIADIITNIMILFISVAIGFYNWWLFLPAIILLGVIHLNIARLWLKVDEVSADTLTLKLGHEYGQIRFLLDLPEDLKIPDGAHESVRSRVKRLQKH